MPTGAARRLLLPVFAALLALSVVPAPAVAQRIELRGRGDAENDAYLQRLVRSGAFHLIARDTLLGPNDTVPGTALVLGATLRLDGVITGDLVVVDGNVFLRPSGRVLGAVRNVAGGLYASELARVEGGTRSEPNAPYRVERRDDGRIVITGITQRSAVVLYGLSGLLPPTYDRVDGLTLTASAGYLLPRIGLIEPIVRAHGDYRSQRGALTGGGELAAARRRTEVAVGAERTTLTNERWIHSDLTNTATSLFLGKDRRDYYEAERGYVEVRRLLERGPRVTNAFLRAQVEDARPLRAADPWSLFGSFRDDNITFAASRISSVVAGADMLWTLPLHVVHISGTAELAGSVLDGAHSFNSYALDAAWAMAALRNHTLRIEAYARGPLPGTDSLPGQRWSFVGGDGTLYTFVDARFRGDRIAFVETEYSIPLPRRMRVRLLGLPSLDLLHFAGMAWTADERRSFEQNVGVRLSYNVLFVRAVTHPDRLADDLELVVGVTLPRRAYPWRAGR